MKSKWTWPDMDLSFRLGARREHQGQGRSTDTLDLVFLQSAAMAGAPPEPARGSLNRARSAQAIGSAERPAREDGLKRVSSEPVLSVQEKGALLKRKLSLLEQDMVVDEDGRNKLKKQGGKNFTAFVGSICTYLE